MMELPTDEPRHDLQSWVHPNLHVAPSSIQGMGVFTLGALAADTIVFRIGGTLYTSHQSKSAAWMRSTAIGVAEDIVLAEPAHGERDLSDHLNHSCRPNLRMIDAITIATLAPVASNEELLIDYAYWEGDESWVMNVECGCRNTGCRKVITGKDWREHSVSSELRSRMSPFLQRRGKTTE